MFRRCPVLIEPSPGAECTQPIYRCCPHCRLPIHQGSPWRDGRNRDRNDHSWPCAKCSSDEPGRDRLR